MQSGVRSDVAAQVGSEMEGLLATAFVAFVSPNVLAVDVIGEIARQAELRAAIEVIAFEAQCI